MSTSILMGKMDEVLRKMRLRQDFPGGPVVKTLHSQSRGPGFDPWVRKIVWNRKWEPTPQYSWVENPMDRGAWWATIQGVQRVRHNWAIEHTYTHNMFTKKPWKCLDTWRSIISTCDIRFLYISLNFNVMPVHHFCKPAYHIHIS